MVTGRTVYLHIVAKSVGGERVRESACACVCVKIVDGVIDAFLGLLLLSVTMVEPVVGHLEAGCACHGT